MGKKRKSVASKLDEVDRTMYSTFCSAANSLSQLYTHSMNQQKLSFLSGQRHALENLYQWILREQEGGSRVTTVDILNYLQSELDYNGEEQSMSPNSGFHVSSGSIGVAGVGHDQQPKNNVFSNALSSPVRRSLQNYHIAEGAHFPSNGTRQNESNPQNLNRDSNSSYNSADASMDMHSDSPAHDSTY